MKRKIVCILTALIIMVVTGCQSSNIVKTNKVDGVEKLGEITVISREEGSGTRASFAQIADFEETENDKKSDLTTSDAIIVEKASDVVKKVSEDKAAIGYISAGTKIDNSVKVLNVDGIAPTDNKYGLLRPFYVVYNGKINEGEEDFLRFVEGMGQSVVAKSYMPIGKESTFLSLKPSGAITVSGSTSVTPLMEELANQYKNYNPNLKISVKATNSTEGINDTLSGKSDLGMVSRELENYESELLNYRLIARDSINVIVNKDNPVTNISIATIKSIFTGKITNWKEYM